VTALESEIERTRRSEIARGIRTLLSQPLLTAAEDPDGFDAVRRRGPELVEWFDANCGWRLEVEARSGYARLAKVTDHPDATRPARRQRSTRAPFDRRRYVLLCVVAAELFPSPATTIGILADRVTQATALDPELPGFDSGRHEDRRAYVDALKLLERWGAIATVDGETDAFLDQQQGARVLYRVDAARLSRLLAAPQAPSRLESADLEDLVAEPRYGASADPDAPVADNQRNLWLRHSITRRVLDDPVVYFADLTDEQRAYATTLTGRRLIRSAVEVAGMQLEERAEGLLAVDPDAIATDVTFPAPGSVTKQAALLLLDVVLGAEGPTPTSTLTAHLEARLTELPDWARTYQSEGGAGRLVEEAVGLLRELGLVTVEWGLVRPRPAASRYAVGATTIRGGREAT
jgi:uncharacterized protein (TIGR02678 family)